MKPAIKSSADLRSAVTPTSGRQLTERCRDRTFPARAGRRPALQQTGGLRYVGTVHGKARVVTAFTLVEVLLALVICAIVLVAINAVFATAVRLRDRTTAGIDDSLPVEHTLQVMSRDLKGAVGPGGFLAGDFKCGSQAMASTMGMSGEAGAGGLDFFTDTGAISDKAPWGDVQEIFYELKAPLDRNKAGMDLVRCVNRNLLAVTSQTPEIQTLLSHVETVDFDCYDGSMWRNVWDTSTGDTNLPTAVRIRIHMLAGQGEDASKKAPLELMVPMVTLTRTNQVASGR